MYAIEPLLNATPCDALNQPLKCVGRRSETADAATFTFQAEQPSRFHYKPGQFLTFEVEIDGQCYQRAYSLSSSPSRPYALEITVKRVAGGTVSNWLLDHLQPGDQLKAQGPAGSFHLPDQHPEHYLLISAGSGITPLMSMTRWLLDTHQPVTIQFIHSARNVEEMIFHRELTLLATRHANLQVDLLFSQVNDPQGQPQRLNAETLQRLVPELDQQQLFVCGPQGFMDAVAEMARQRDFDMQRFHQESFASEGPQQQAGTPQAQSEQAYQLRIEGREQLLEISGEATLLESLEQAGVPAVAACRAGVCGACKCQVTEGDTEVTSTMTLSEQEVAEGYILSCSARARSDLTLKL